MLAPFIHNSGENSLTASIFSQLLHLPSEEFWAILRNACSENVTLPDHSGMLSLVDPWPKWNPDGTENSRHVEPDLFMRFTDFDLIIEVKPEDGQKHNLEQWQNEWRAYWNMYGPEKKLVLFIAVGTSETTPHKLDPADRGVPDERVPVVYMCSWERLLFECQHMREVLNRAQSCSSRNFADRRILSDLIDIFERRGFAAFQWFADFDFESNLLGCSIDLDAQRFRNISLQFKRS